jgi:hypothetical protein
VFRARFLCPTTPFFAFSDKASGQSLLLHPRVRYPQSPSFCVHIFRSLPIHIPASKTDSNTKMCQFSDYFYACYHPAVNHAFCTRPCPRYADLARHGNSRYTPGWLNPNNLPEGCRCPDMQTNEHSLPYACRGCRRRPQYRQSPNPAAVPVRTAGIVWHIPETPSCDQHLRTTNPWADDRREDDSEEDREAAARRRREERRSARSVSPKGRSGSGVDRARPSVGGSTSWKNLMGCAQRGDG